MDKLVEPHGVWLSESVIRRMALAQGRAIFEGDVPQEEWPAEPGAEQIIAEMDGGMVPIMEPEVAQADRRQGKHGRWKEAQVALVPPWAVQAWRMAARSKAMRKKPGGYSSTPPAGRVGASLANRMP
jgi:hypothetical protein